MASSNPPPSVGERLTLTYTTRGSLPLRVDIYPFAARPPATSTSSSFPPPSPFVLYLHSSPRNPCFAGSRRSVPPWLFSVCKKNGWPLLSADYRLAPEATLSDSWSDLQALWAFIEDEGAMNWAIASAGGGSEADSGLVTLGDGLTSLQQRGGIAAHKGCIVAPGGTSYLGAIGGAMLKPAPLAIFLTHPILDPTAPFYTRPSPPLPPSPAVKRRIARLQSVLAKAGQVQEAIAEASDLDPHGRDSPNRSNWDPAAWWRSRAAKKDRIGHVQGRERQSLYAVVLRSGQLARLLEPPVRLDELTAMTTSSAKTQTPVNRPFPPIMILNSVDDTFIDVSAPDRFLQSLRNADPAATVMDHLLDLGLEEQMKQSARAANVSAATAKANAAAAHPSRRARGSDTKSTATAAPSSTGELFDPSRRFIHRTISKAFHGFDCMAQRDDERFAGEFDAAEAFLANWVGYAEVSERAALSEMQQRGRTKRHEKL
ncbi:unnamed protein product [Jaminaea pallidilutea]